MLLSVCFASVNEFVYVGLGRLKHERVCKSSRCLLDILTPACNIGVDRPSKAAAKAVVVRTAVITVACNALRELFRVALSLIELKKLRGASAVVHRRISY